MKVMTVVGTRPELIRLSQVIGLLDRTVEHVLVHTGQNYDHALNQVFFDDLGLRPPAHRLDVDTSSLGRVLGETLIRVEEVLVAERPDALLVLGDTNSTIAAVIARRRGVPVFHMEAGNRCFDPHVPEEVNRRLVDHVADFNLVYTEHARRNLLAEGLHPRRILLTGSPMAEVLSAVRPGIAASTVLDRLELTGGEFLVVSAHREENVDPPDRLRRLLDCLRAVRRATGLPLVVSTHPRTRRRLGELDVDLDADPGVRFLPPFGFHDYLRLQCEAHCVLSDSGTLPEESAVLGFPAVALRESTERPEALDAGTLVLAGLDAEDVVAAVGEVTQEPRSTGSLPAGYEVTDTSRRVVRFILSATGRHRGWAGLRPVW